jgi:hypothetical protein
MNLQLLLYRRLIFEPGIKTAVSSLLSPPEIIALAL